MSKLTIRTVILVVVILAAATAMADGVMIPGPWPRPPHMPPLPEPIPPFAVKYHHVDVTIEDQVAHTCIDQVFVSQAHREIEATYLFPVPTDAVIDEFNMWVNGVQVAGEVKDKDEARRIYESIVSQRRDPALLEYVGRGLIRARVYPVPPRGEQRIRIEYREILKKDSGLVRYTYPLNTEKFSAKPIESVRVSVDIKSKTPIKNVYSPTHTPSIRRPDEHTASLSHEEAHSRPDTDFTVYYSLSEDDIGLSLLTYQPAGEDGYFLFLASPRAQVQDHEIEAKDMVFVIDRTGSMSGKKMDQAREALKFALRNLNEGDRFNVIAFNESPDPWFDGLLPANRKHIDMALERAERIEASGGTNIDEALTTALPMLHRDDRPGYVLFLTDGLPTVGVTDVQVILKNTAAVAPGHVRLFVFGVGYDVNTTLLDQLAEDHRGYAEYVRPDEDIEVKVSSLYRKISFPVLANLELHWSEGDAYDLYPQQLPDLFKGSQVVLTGRYRGEGRMRLELTGQAGGREHAFKLRHKPDRDDRHDFIPQLWANRKIGFLLGEIRRQGHNRELVDEVIRLSKKYGIITEYTSFLIEEPSVVFGADYEDDARGRFSALNADKMAAESGASAVNQSVAIGAKKDAVAAPSANAQVYFNDLGEAVTVKQVYNVANRTFFQQDSAWVENTFTEGMEVLEVKNFSEAQFQLLQQDPALGRLMAMGDEVLLLINGNAVKIGESGVESFSEKELKNLFGS